MTELPDFSAYCEQACRMLWGEPTRTTPKRLSWTNGDAYGGRTFDVAKRAWYDHDAERGGSTLELVAYDKGEPVKKLSGDDFFEAWQTAHNKGWVPDPPPPKKGGGSVWDLLDPADLCVQRRAGRAALRDRALRHDGFRTSASGRADPTAAAVGSPKI